MLDSSQSSPNLTLPLVMPDQAQKHVTVNESLMRLDVLVQARARSRTLGLQPPDPGEGDAWILPDGSTGAAWDDFAKSDLAVWRDGFWSRLAPREGWRVWCEDEKAMLTFSQGRWRVESEDRLLAEGPAGAAMRAIVLEHVETGLAGDEIVTGAVIPARSVVFCVSVRTLDTITGAQSLDCGVAGEASKFGGSLGLTAGASNLGVIGPTAYYSDTPIHVRANGGSFTGGALGIAIHAWTAGAMPDQTV